MKAGPNSKIPKDNNMLIWPSKIRKGTTRRSNNLRQKATSSTKMERRAMKPRRQRLLSRLLPKQKLLKRRKLRRHQM